MRLLRLTLCLLIPFISAAAQQLGYVENQAQRLPKFENGMFIFNQKVSKDPTTNQIEIFDLQGRLLVGINVLRLVPEARRVSVYDVSARRGGPIVVAAVYENKLDNPAQCKDLEQRIRPVETLLFFDFAGHLESALLVEPSRSIKRLALDDQSNVWTLTTGADGKDPSSIPMLVEYDAEGTVKRQLLPRSMFPTHAKHTEQGSAIGAVTMGFDAGVVWFWLPGSTDLVTVSSATGAADVVQTKLPKVNGNLEPVMVFRKASGNVVAQIREIGKDGNIRFSYQEWSPSTGSWSEFRPGSCDDDWLIGVSGDDQFYDRIDEGAPGKRRTNLCRFSGQ